MALEATTTRPRAEPRLGVTLVDVVPECIAALGTLPFKRPGHCPSPSQARSCLLWGLFLGFLGGALGPRMFSVTVFRNSGRVQRWRLWHVREQNLESSPEFGTPSILMNPLHATHDRDHSPRMTLARNDQNRQNILQRLRLMILDAHELEQVCRQRP